MAARNYLAVTTVVKAVGFDLDETLIFYPSDGINRISFCAQALEHAADALQIRPTKEQIEIGRQILARHTTVETNVIEEVSAKKLFRQILDAWHIACSPEQIETAIDLYFECFRPEAEAYPEVSHLLRALQKKKIKVGAFADVPYGMPLKFVARDLERAGLSELLENIVTSVDVGARKPNPTGFLALAKFLGVKPKETIYVGSDRRNIEGANNAGMISVLVDRNQRNLDLGQQFTISRLDVLLEFL